MCGRKTDAFSKASLEVFGCVQGTSTSWLAASCTFEQKWLRICLCTLPGWAPQFPVCAIASKSVCCAPSCIAQSASSLINVALRVPLAHRNKSLFANTDSATHPSAFSKALPALACFVLTVSISNCHPRSLFAIVENTSFPKEVFKQPFPKGVLKSSFSKEVEKQPPFPKRQQNRQHQTSLNNLGI